MYFILAAIVFMGGALFTLEYSGLNDIVIGGIVPQTGSLSAQGQAQAEAIKLARDDMNRFFSDTGTPFRVKTLIEDSETDQDVAYQKLEKLIAKGIKLIVGPNTSSSTQACIKLANEKQILMISPSATASSLAHKGDNFFRLCPNDISQAKALSEIFAQDEIKAITCISRNDVWGNGLHDHLKTFFSEEGGQIASNIRYSPNTKNFEKQIKDLALNLEMAIGQYGKKHVAVQVTSFEEVKDILEYASQYKILKSVRWYGSDGSSGLKPLLDSKKASEFAIHVGLECPKFNIIEDAEEKFEAFKNRMQLQGHRDIDAYVALAYDCTKLLILSATIAQDKPQIKYWKNALEFFSKNTTGLTGWNSLDENGDRNIGDYSFWKISKNQENRYVWEVARTYHKHSPEH